MLKYVLIPLNQLSMLLFYLYCMYKSIKSSYKASICVEIAFGQNVLPCTFIWPKCPWPECPGRNVLAKMSVAEASVHPFVHIFDIISLFAAELEEPIIGISGKGLTLHYTARLLMTLK